MPVAEFYDIRPQTRTLSPAGCSLVALALVDSNWQIERNQGETRLPIRLIFKPKNVLMSL